MPPNEPFVLPESAHGVTRKGLPGAYSRFAHAVDNGVPLKRFGLKSSRPEVFRFANRYRVAGACRGIVLQGYSHETVVGYGGLLRVFVTWSAVEQYLTVTNQKKREDELLDPDENSRLVDRIRNIDAQGVLFCAVASRTTGRNLRCDVESYLNGDSVSVFVLVRALRNVFVHGDLAPGSNSASPGIAHRIADAICPAILAAIYRDFSSRVEDVLSAEKNKRMK